MATCYTALSLQSFLKLILPAMATKGDQLELHEVRFDIPEGDPSGLSLVRLGPSVLHVCGTLEEENYCVFGIYILVRGYFISQHNVNNDYSISRATLSGFV